MTLNKIWFKNPYHLPTNGNGPGLPDVKMAEAVMRNIALNDPTCKVNEMNLSGAKISDAGKVVEEFCTKFGFRVIYRCHYDDGGGSWFMVNDGDGSTVHFSMFDETSVNFITLDETKIKPVEEWWDEKIPDYTQPAGTVHVMVATMEGLRFKPVPKIGAAFIPENYSEDVRAAYTRIVSSLKETNPNGRIAILDGPPGCGKTYLVRGLLQEDLDCKFVIVPSTAVASLANPDILPALLDFYGRPFSEEKRNPPVVFIIEDADECLAKRDAANTSAVSALLNFGDGLLGQAMDIRIIATTNTPRQDLDPAVVRPGRLNTNIHVGHLPLDYARTLLSKLVKREVQDDEWKAIVREQMAKDMSLAMIYTLAADRDWVARAAPPQAPAKLGF